MTKVIADTNELIAAVPGDLRRAGRIGREANRAQTGGPSPAGTLSWGSANAIAIGTGRDSANFQHAP